MRTRTMLSLAAITAIVAFQAFPKKADTGELPQGQRNRPASGAGAPVEAALRTGLAAEPSQPTPAKGDAAPAPSPRAPAPAPEAPPATTDAAGDEGSGPSRADVEALHREGLEALMQGDEPLAAQLLLRAARARTSAPEREDAAKRLPAIEAAALERVKAARAGGAHAEERRHLTTAYLACMDPKRRQEHRARLDELCADLAFSPRVGEGSEAHVVKSGDSLMKIAAKYNFPVDGIIQINRLKTPAGKKEPTLRVGDRLKVLRGTIEVLVVKSEFRLVLLQGGLYLKEYAVGTGKGGCTPEASFTIDDKVKEPTWYSREGAFPFGDPKNILGTRWLRFQTTEEHKGFGIHGTAYPESIGKEESSGCVRMRNAEVEELFGFVPKGTRCHVVR